MNFKQLVVLLHKKDLKLSRSTSKKKKTYILVKKDMATLRHEWTNVEEAARDEEQRKQRVENP